MPNKPRFAICISNEGYEVSLEVRKLYSVLPDRKAAQHGMIRIVDESGEDYLYPDDLFIAAELPQRIEKAIAAAS